MRTSSSRPIAFDLRRLRNARARELARHTSAITVIVSHRFSTVTGADRILVVLDRGRLVEHGTHSELLAAAGRYADLYRIQAAAYQRVPARMGDPPVVRGSVADRRRSHRSNVIDE
jgi:ABC-type multidrug transport system ATPase subunit